MAVTIKDIARRVGKSVTTVSRALHDYNDVSPETKEMVREAAAEMGYTPNILAQRLQKQKADTIGFVIPTFGPRFSDPFFSEFLAGVGNKAADLGYDLLVSTRSPGEEEMAAYRENVRGRRVDGFIIVRTRRQDQRISYLTEAQFPFVAFGRSLTNMDFPYVDEDGAFGMKLVAEHLFELGHRTIACITPPLDLMFAVDRLDGFRKSLNQLGIPLDESLVRKGDLTQRSGYQQASDLLDSPQPITAIVAFNDLMAFGAVRAARERRLVVGEDIAITGFDNIPLAEHFHPALTTVHQPIYKIGGMVCEMLIKIIRDQPLESSQVLLKPSLVIRESSGVA